MSPQSCPGDGLSYPVIQILRVLAFYQCLVSGSAVTVLRNSWVEDFVKGPNAEGHERQWDRHDPVHPKVLPAVGFEIGQREEGLVPGSKRQQTLS